MEQDLENESSDRAASPLPCPPNIQRGLEWLAHSYLGVVGLAAIGGVFLPVVGWLKDYGPKSPGQWLPFPIFLFFGGGLMFGAWVAWGIRSALQERQHLGAIGAIGSTACVASLVLFYLGAHMPENMALRPAALFIGLVGVATLWYVKRPEVVAVFPPEPELQQPVAR